VTFVGIRLSMAGTFSASTLALISSAAFNTAASPVSGGRTPNLPPEGRQDRRGYRPNSASAFSLTAMTLSHHASNSGSST
jgi:hypothetical protein